jgi:hypothetical protein
VGRTGKIVQIVITAILGVIAFVGAVTYSWGLYFSALAMVVAGVSQFRRLPPRQS